MNAILDLQTETELTRLDTLFATQQAHFRANPNSSCEERLKDLEILRSLIVNYKDRLVEAVAEDYGHRSTFDTLISDISGTLHSLEYTRKNLKKWMKPSKRSAGLMLAPSKAYVHYQPIGVVGIIVPWNFPIGLSLSPLLTALATGNTAMLKMSEFTPKTNAVLKTMLAEGFAESKVALIEGEVEVATRFSQLPFNHIIFTGSTAVGKHIMRAASANLTPVTLELGGKSPTIIGPDFDVQQAVERIAFAKSINSGQACVAPDYVLMPAEKVTEFIDAYKAYFNSMFKDGINSKDYTSIVNQRQYQRLKSVLKDASDKGAIIDPVRPVAFDDNRHRMIPHLVTGVTDQMTVMQEELFGPILPIIGYQSVDEAHQYVLDHDRPLALYIISNDKALQERFVTNTLSGGVCINDLLMQVAVDDAPFGGNGPSGIGHYHGPEGFKTLSHAKTVLNRGSINFTKLLHPPYDTWFKKTIIRKIGG
ncbi:coniferyl aldehyde dehydrogenase [Vibrio superstes]|uniref:Aldehyde dehydrogenase n=1 Tax=Vibrio superstes NBRC 103154 TaxID=1219062 RepID=A0A511QP12_9VIBR|nr:coniferyl aldehyde dehydrogenase [Vibrio superstes]GEM78877.1 aldehyde dehydrogenase [Vibrio superstes NBRC 103154]